MEVGRFSRRIVARLVCHRIVAREVTDRASREGYHLSRPRDSWDAFLKQKLVEERREEDAGEQEDGMMREKERERWRARRERRGGGGYSEANGVGPWHIAVGDRWWWGARGTHKAEILRAGAGAPRGLRRRNHNAERS